MGFMRDQAIRLIRTKWATPTQLAEELYAIFTSNMPIQMDSRLDIKNPSDDPAITVENAKRKSDRDDNNDFLRMKAPHPNQDRTIRGRPEDDDPQGDEKKKKEDKAKVFPGKILSGTGDTYSVAIYENGAGSATTQTVSVKQLQIDTDETIPADTWAIVVKTGSEYSMQVPVWLTEEE